MLLKRTIPLLPGVVGIVTCRGMRRHCIMGLLVVTGLALGPTGQSGRLVAAHSADRREGAPSADSASALPRAGSSDDGWLDISDFLDEPYGFLPIVGPITEPAVGYGLWAMATFISRPPGLAEAGFGRPNITLAGGMATENGSRGVVAGDLRHWLEDRLQTTVGFVSASVNLDFYGIGDDALLKEHPLSYTLRPVGGLARAKYRVGRSVVWVGMGYVLAEVQMELSATEEAPSTEEFRRDTRVGGITPSINYDSRDNIFTPTLGTYGELSAGIFGKALGGDASFQRLSLIGMQYLPLSPNVTLGLRGDAYLSFGDVPFYLRPFIFLRGVPVMRYQGEHVGQVEVEARWQFWKRISLVGFSGYGAAWNNFAHFESPVKVVTGGLGARYELAARYGMHAGVDVGFGPDGAAIYITVGSAWARP